MRMHCECAVSLGKVTATENPESILFLVPTLAPYGAERVMRTLAEEARRTSSRVLVAVLDDLDGPELSLHDGIGLLRLSRRRRGLLGIVEAVFKVRHLVRKADPDYIVGVLTVANVVLGLAAPWRVFRRKVLLTEHGLADPTRRNKAVLRLLQVSIYRLLRPSVVCVSTAVARHVRSLAPSAHIAVVPNPIDEATLRQLGNQEIDHPWFVDRTPGTQVFVCVGRLEPSKNQIAALRLLCSEEFWGARLAVLGQGPDLPSLEAEALRLGIADRVAFLGYVANPYAYIARADLLVHFSEREGFGMVLLEATAVGTPVAASPIAAFMELVPASVNGAISAGSTSEDYLDCARRALRLRPSEPADLTRFSPEACWQGYLALLAENKCA